MQIQEKLESFEEGCGEKVKRAMRSFFQVDLDEINDRLEGFQFANYFL